MSTLKGMRQADTVVGRSILWKLGSRRSGAGTIPEVSTLRVQRRPWTRALGLVHMYVSVLSQGHPDPYPSLSSSAMGRRVSR